MSSFVEQEPLGPELALKLVLPRAELRFMKNVGVVGAPCPQEYSLIRQGF